MKKGSSPKGRLLQLVGSTPAPLRTLAGAVSALKERGRDDRDEEIAAAKVDQVDAERLVIDAKP